MESSFLIEGAKVFPWRGTIRRNQQELAPTPRRWRQVERTSEPGGVRCLRCDRGKEAERRGRGVEMEEDDEEWKEMGKWAGENCRGEGEIGMVEMMECLEKEAIMGEDSGKEPADYDRRARIFDKSSEVFQAIREGEADEEHLHHQHSPDM